LRHKTNNAEAREVLSDTSRRIGAMGAAQQVFYSVRNSTDVSGQSFVEAVPMPEPSSATIGIARIMQTGWFKEVCVKDLNSHAVRALLASRHKLPLQRALR
jgi:two-component sensor histidine kinase